MHPELPRTRAEAKALGASQYFTGKPCKHGHVSPRYVAGTCLACNADANKTFHAARPEHRSEYMHDWRRRNLGYPMPTRPKPPNCELCRQLPGGRGLFIDHDHQTGAFRGWLCQSCNGAIGQLGDDLPGLLCAVAYLKRGLQ